jgi:hypothetical protein
MGLRDGLRVDSRDLGPPKIIDSFGMWPSFIGAID